MLRLRFCAAGLAFALTAGVSVYAAVIADYRGEYVQAPANTMTRPSVSADGWDYMWNANAPIGAAAGNYTSLYSWGSGYNFDGLGGLPRPAPATWVYVHPTGGHPGSGADTGGTFDRYAITAYTLQTGEGGLVRIVNSSLSVGSSASNGVEARVYVNDIPVGGYVQQGGAQAGNYNAVLGFLSPTDTVYVAMGPNRNQGSDSFNVSYQLETFTDSNTRLWNAGSGNWDTISSVWLDTSGAPATFSNNQNAVFLPGGGTVTLVENITARNLSFSGDGYTIAATGGNGLTLTTAGSGGPGPATIEVPLGTATISAPITGGSPTKTGGGTLELTGNNTFTGITNIAGGTLTVSGTGAITTDRLRNSAGGVTLNVADNASITANSYMVFGDASGASMTINQSGGSVTSLGATNNPAGNNVSNRWGHWSGGANVTYNLSGGTLNLLNAPLYLSWDGAATLNVSGGTANILGIDMGYNGRTQASTINLSSGTLSIGSGGIYYTGTATNKNINLTGGTLTASDSWSSSLDIHHTGTVWVDTNGHDISLSGVLSGGGSVNKIGTGRLSLTGGGSYASLNVAAGDATLGGPSTTTTVTSGLQVGNAHTAGGGSASLDIVDGDLTTRWIQLGNTPGTLITATINQTGGSVRTTSAVAESAGLRLGHYPASTTFYNLSGGTLLVDNDFYLACAVDGTGTFTQTGGEATATRVVVNARSNGGGNGTFTVQGGTFNVGSGGIVNDAGPYAVNLGGLGGTIKASDDFSSSLNMTLSGTDANAINFDTNGNNITLSGTLSGTGGLNKVGDGTLVITSTSSNFTGPTTVSGGTLSVANGRLYDIGWASTTITVTGGAVLEVGGWADGDALGIGRVSFEEYNIVIDGGAIRYTGSSNNGRPDRGFTIGAGGATLDASGGNLWNIAEIRSQFDITSTQGGLLTLTGTTYGEISKEIPGTGGVTKTGNGTWTLSGNNTYTGATSVNAGTLVVDGSIAPSSGVNVAAGATLSGHGTVSNVSGAGLVSPGNSPGILTVESSVDGSTGLDFAFEFTADSPDYGTPGASLNDVLRLTDSSDPFQGTPLDADNVVDIYLNTPDLAVGDTIRGGFYTDRAMDFTGEIDGATFNFYVAGAGGPVEFGGVDYFPLADYLDVTGLTVSTVYDPADFGAGLVGGYVMQLTAVPEPASLALAALGLVLLIVFGRRKRCARL